MENVYKMLWRLLIQFSSAITAGDGSGGRSAVISHSRGDAQLDAETGKGGLYLFLLFPCSWCCSLCKLNSRNILRALIFASLTSTNSNTFIMPSCFGASVVVVLLLFLAVRGGAKALFSTIVSTTYLPTDGTTVYHPTAYRPPSLLVPPCL